VTAVAEHPVKAKKAKPPKPAAKPGDKDFDWASEYPGEEFYVYTASDGTTVGIAKLSPKRKPKPGKLALLDDEGNGMRVLWYLLKVASTETSRRVQAELEEEDYTQMVRKWADFADIELGES
jgi:hypothetical protein